MSNKINTPEITEIVSGNLNKVSLPKLLISLGNSKKTGTLDINSKYELSIFVDKGYPYFAAGGSGETLLGKILLNRNKITKYQYDKAAEEIKKNKDRRIGEILVSLGMITPHELNDYLEMQLKEKILESFLYLEGSYEFKEVNGTDKSIFYSKINTPELIHEGFQRFIKSSEVDFEVFDVEFVKDLNDKTSNIGLRPKELRLVQLINQNQSLKNVEKSGKFKKDEIVRVVLLLGLYDIAKIRNFSINNYLLDVFRNFLVMNPLPDLADSSYTVKESELTAPTGEVLLLDDELEATAERERLELRNRQDNKDEEAGMQGATEKFRFQEEYEGDQDPVEIDKPRKNNAEAKVKAKKGTKEGRDIKINSLGEQHVSDDSNGKDKEEPVTESMNKTEQAPPEEDGSVNESEVNEETEESEEDIRIDEPDEQDEQVKKDNGAAVKELAEFYDFIQKEEDYYKTLRVDSVATSEEIKDSYYQLIKKFHPDVNSNFTEGVRIKAEQIFTKVTNAYEILIDERKRLEYDERDELNKLKDKANSIYEAELIYTEGEMLLRQRNYQEAEKKFFSAVEMNPDESAYIGIYDWAKYLAAADKEKVLDDVKKELNKAIEMDPGFEQNYYFLGSIYKFTENFARAEKNFQKAVEIDPNYIEAKRELRLIQNRKNQTGKPKETDKKIEKKFWSGLFKK